MSDDVFEKVQLAGLVFIACFATTVAVIAGAGIVWKSEVDEFAREVTDRRREKEKR